MAGVEGPSQGEGQSEQSALESHRAAIRKIEADIRKALAEREKLKPSGLFGMFGGGGDPAKLEEVEMTLQILQVELADRRQQLRVALKAAEEAEHLARKEALLPPGIPDAETAARMAQALGRLETILGDLRSMAGAATRARAAQNHSYRMTRGYGHGGIRERRDHDRRARMNAALRSETSDWDALLDEAEWMADIALFPLALPRRYDGAPRPDHAPQPSPEVELARKAHRVQDDGDFGPALEMAPSQIQQYSTQIVHIREALFERFPEARSIAATAPFEPFDASGSGASSAAASDAPVDVLIADWEALRRTYAEIGKAVAKRASTVAFLDPVGVWQRRAKRVRENPIAIEHGLLPPLNDGADLAGFVTRVQAEWPDLDARFTARVENRS